LSKLLGALHFLFGFYLLN
jgi:hypothetical protein